LASLISSRYLADTKHKNIFILWPISSKESVKVSILKLKNDQHIKKQYYHTWIFFFISQNLDILLPIYSKKLGPNVLS